MYIDDYMELFLTKKSSNKYQEHWLQLYDKEKCFLSGL